MVTVARSSKMWSYVCVYKRSCYVNENGLFSNYECNKPRVPLLRQKCRACQEKDHIANMFKGYIFQSRLAPLNLTDVCS